MSACASSEEASVAPLLSPPPMTNRSTAELVGAGDTEASARLGALDRVTADNPSLKILVRDIRAMLLAAERSAAGDQKGAQRAWFEALQSARGGFGRQAFAGWLKSYTTGLGQKSEATVLARLIMAETQQGRISPYMQDKGLTTDAAIVPLLATLVPEWLTRPTTAHDKPTDSSEPTPPGLSTPNALPPDDPLLLKTAVRVCRTRSKDKKPWLDWRAKLTPGVKLYWQGLLEEKCGPGATAALESMRQAYPKLGQDPVTIGLAIEAAGRVAAIQRATGQRQAAADTYRDLVALWATDGLTPGVMGLDPAATTLRRIDEILWAARYRSLIGDYETAKIFAQQALDLGRAMAVKRTTYKKAVRGQLAALRADGYHTLAYRIATEQQQFGSARSLALLGLAVPDLPQEWHDRLAWLAGLYEYLDGNYGSAEKRWQDLINRTTDDGIRAAAYFWSARCQQQLGDMPAATKTIALLSRRYPLSYYAVVATKEAKINETSTLPAALGSLTDLPEALAKRRDFHVQAVRQSPLLGPLLSRAEVVTAANLGTIARQAVGELEQAMNPNLAVGSNLAAYVYLSRLQYRAGSYLAAISLTTKLAKVDPAFWSAWPEQVLVSFAQPYTEEYAYSAEHSGVARELLLGISRQESGFTADIRSSANAIGLMQLIPPTARRFAAELGLPTDHVEDLLRDPLTNIRLGSRYLKWLSLRYRGFPPTTYAAYNAGEYVVDLWLKRRAHSDPLMFVELIPFGETKDYVKSVWRNVFLYRHLLEADLPQELPGFDLGFAGVVGA